MVRGYSPVIGALSEGIDIRLNHRYLRCMVTIQVLEIAFLRGASLTS